MYRNQIGRILAMVCAACFFAIGLADVIFRIGADDPEHSFARTYENNYARPDGPLGRGPMGPGEYRATLEAEDGSTVAFDVVYTIGKHGYRVVEGGGAGADTYLFFGGSFTYGEGVEDDETFPAHFSQSLNQRFTIVNTSFHGYGPHQMLRALETGFVDPQITGKVRKAYFLLIWDHVNRVKNFYYHARHAPRYVLDEDGTPQYKGELRNDFAANLYSIMRYSGGAIERISDAVMWRFLGSGADELLVSIIDRSAELIREKYDAELVVLMWDREEMGNNEAALKERGIHVVRVSSLIGDLDDPSMTFTEFGDRHPSPLAHDLLGKALAELEKKASEYAPSSSAN